ncbi:unnamed protein product [Sphagnum jensenii]
MEEIVPDTDNIDIERQTSYSVSNMAEGQGKSDTKERIANFISEEQTSPWTNFDINGSTVNVGHDLES